VQQLCNHPTSLIEFVKSPAKSLPLSIMLSFQQGRKAKVQHCIPNTCRQEWLNWPKVPMPKPSHARVPKRASERASARRYAYTLSGHEYAAAGGLVAAEACYRNALRADPRAVPAM
jgi:hypothetical protein